MADLNAGERARDEDGHATGRSGRGRGQIILVGAFALAVVFVALALVMNAAIYTENLATRSESAGTADAHVFERTTTKAAEEAFRYAHEVNASDHEGLRRNVTQAMDAYHNVTRTQQAAGGQLVDVAVVPTPPAGTNVTETNTVFESPGGTGDWTVASGVSGTRSFRLDVENWLGDSDDELWVVAGDADDWYLNVSYDGSLWEVGVNDSGTYTTCATTAASDVTIDVSDGTVDGDECAALTLGDVGGSYALKIRNGSVADGDYTMIADVEPTAVAAGVPTEEVLYAMTVDLTYRTPELRYRTTIRVAPGETGG
ncbi:hypothetical protein I7X12_02215 [Halosimplex litoreum]|uniref:Uncharacterized protein n=1 Tax=Halosimplex litoreum TaxID=1198301 RepID=A0A7T3FZ94_9EURY|nr:hypothetical protein [Halosimplex litoreum]QPV63470.1 hypothetical protein I7X12_02215 [Halosimplex litoreum]